MHVIVVSTAFDVNGFGIDLRAVLPQVRRAVQIAALATQGVAFSAGVWLMLAGPGFVADAPAPPARHVSR